MPLAAPLLETRLSGLAPHRQGKVRDIFDLGESLLMVATDRISAFDYVLGSGIPDKGRVLTQLSAFWFERTAGIVPNHLLTMDVREYPAEMRQFADVLAGRSMLVRKTNPVPIECVARGYLSGSGWKEYQASGSVCGVALPPACANLIGCLRRFSRPPQSHNWSRRERQRGRSGAARRRAVRSTAAGADSRALCQFGRPMPNRAASSLPTRSSSLVSLIRTRSSSSTRRSPPTRRDIGHVTSTRPGGRSRASTSSTCATISSRSGGTSSRPFHRCPMTVVTRTREKYVEAYRRLTGKELA